LRQPELTEQQIWGTAVCSAIAARNRNITGAILTEAEKRLSPPALYAAPMPRLPRSDRFHDSVTMTP